MPTGFEGLADDLATPEDRETARGLAVAQDFAATRSPDLAAQAYQYAKDKGVHFELAEEIQAEPAQRMDPSWAGLERESPTLAKALQDMGLAAAAKDDVQNLSLVEKLFRGWQDMAWGAGQAFQSGARTMKIGRLSMRQAEGRATPADIAEIKRLEAEEASNQELKFGYLSGFIPMSAQQVSQWLEPFRNPEATTRIWGTGGVGAVAGAAGGLAIGGVGAAPAGAAGFLSGVGAGYQAESALANGDAEGGNAYREYVRDGIDHEAAAAGAQFVRLVNGGIEYIALNKVLGIIPGAQAVLRETIRGTLRVALKDATRRAAVVRLVKSIAAKGFVEGAQEAAQEFVTIFEGIRLKPEQPDTWTAMKEAVTGPNLDRIVESGVAGTQMSLIGLPSSVVAFRADLAKARQAEVWGGFYTALGEAAKGSKTRERLPSVFRAFVDAVQEETGGPVESVKVPASNLTTLFQTEGITEAEVAQEMPEVARQLAEAKEQGTPDLEVAVPIADMATKIAPLSGYAALHEDMRIGDGLTIRESKKVMAEAERIYTENQEGKVEATPEQKVVLDVAAKLEAAGYHPKTAKVQAALWGAFMNARAAKTGAADAWDYYQKARVEVVNSAVAPPVDRTGLIGERDRIESELSAIVREAGVDNIHPEGEQIDEVASQKLGPEKIARRVTLIRRLEEVKQELRSAPVGQTTLSQTLSDSTGVRGAVTFDDARTFFRITLTGKANLSTFLHESGHSFIEMLRRDAAAGHAESQTDIAALEEFAGVQGGAWTVDAQEKLARAFEKYLAEGEAPSNRLEAAFRSFKDWMVTVYRNLVGLNVELDDKTRQVFSRLLATDQEINERARVTGLTMPDFGEVKGGIFTEAEHSRLKAMWDDGVAAMKESLLAKSIAALRQDVEQERKRVESEVSAELNADKAQNAWAWLTTGRRLDDAPVEFEHGKLGAQAVKDAPITDQERRRLRKFITDTDFGFTADEMAPYFGFDSGSDLIVALARRESLQKARRRMVDERMAAMYPEGTADFVAQGATAEVTKALEGRLGRVLEAELDAIGQKIGGEKGRLILASIRQAARRLVAGMTLTELDPAKYARAAAKAQKDYVEAIAKGEGAIAAFQAKRAHAWALEMWRASTEAQADGERIRKYLASFEDITKRAKIRKAGVTYLAAIDALLESISFRKMSGPALQRQGALAAYIAKLQAEGETVVIPPETLVKNDLGEGGELLKNYRQMSLDELIGVEAAVSNLETLARLKNKLTGIQAARRLEATSGDLADSIHDSWAEKGGGKIHPGITDDLKHYLRKGRADLLKIEFLCRALDGGKTAGLAHTLIFQPMARAEAEKMRLVEQILGEFKRPFDAMPVAERMRLHRKVDFLGEQLSFSEVIAIALNWGNEGNREKLLGGYKHKGWTEERVQARLDELLEARDWQLVTHTWKTIDTLFPMIADLARRSVGVEVDKVHGVTIQTRHGPVQGGYYPVVYDRRQPGPRAGKGMALRSPEEIAQMKTGELWENNFMSPGGLVERGFTKSRTKYSAPILLSLSVVPAHVGEVIHYLTHYEAVRDVDKLLRQDVVKSAIEDAVGVEGYQAFRPWLQAVANNGRATGASLYYETMLRKARLGTSIVMLGAKFTTGLIQALGLLPAMKELKTKHMLSGFRTFLSDGFSEAREKSPSFRYQEEHFDRDLGDMYDRMASSFGEVSHLRNQVTTLSMAWIKLVQGSVNAITWYAAREQAEAQGHADPVAYADSVVRLTQSSGGVKDLAAVQRGSESQKLFTVMYTYFSTLFGQLAEPIPDTKTGRQKAAIMAARWWWTVMLPVVVEAALRGKKPDHGDEPEDWATFLLKEQLLYGSRTIPFIGDLADAAFSGRQPRGNPWLSTMMKGAKAMSGFSGEGEMSASTKRALIDAVGAITRTPTGGAVNAYRYLDAFTSGRLEEPVQDLLFRAPGGWK